MHAKKSAMIVIPIAVAAAIAAIFAVSSQERPDLENAENEQNPEEVPQPVSAVEHNCTDVKSRVNGIVYDDTGGAQATAASDLLVNEYCQRPDLVQEIGAMNIPAIGIVAYGCEASSGRLGDDALQQSLGEYSDIYCQSAFFGIYEAAQDVLVSSGDLLADLEVREQSGGDPDVGVRALTPAEISESRATLREISDGAKQAMSLDENQRYYESAISLDSSIKLLEEYGQG
jgi:hypothetical protein